MRIEPMATGGMTPASCLGRTVSPIVRTRKNVPINSTRYFIMWGSSPRVSRLAALAHGSPAVQRAALGQHCPRSGDSGYQTGEWRAIHKAVDGSRLLDPHRLREGAVGGNVPDFQADPVATGQLRRELERPLAEGAGVREVDPLAIHLAAVAGDDLGKRQREGPGQVGHKFRLAALGQ